MKKKCDFHLLHCSPIRELELYPSKYAPTIY